MQSTTFSDILNPMTTESFLTDYLGQRILVIPGPPSKFSELLPWSVLNDLLQHQYFEHPRVALVRDGKTLPQETFIADRRLIVPAVTALLRDGATLIMHKVEDMYEPLTRLTEELEGSLQVKVGINMYAGWCATKGFDLHWDDHDVFVLQVSGHKQWNIYGVSKPYPLSKALEPALTPPISGPVWSGLIGSGDLLYIPRGWWHVATPCDEPTLHLTVGFRSPTAIDFFQWVGSRLRDHERIRMDLPRFAESHVQASHFAKLRGVLCELLSEPNLLSRYYSELVGRLRHRPRFCLPFAASRQCVPEFADYRVVLRTEDALRDRDASEIASCESDSVRMKVTDNIVGELAQGLPVRVGQLCEQCGGPATNQVVLDIVTTLATAGYIRIIDPELSRQTARDVNASV